MMDRLSRDPYEALGLTGSPNVAQIRSAFLQKTKQFHPARFARMATDIQKLANEVFLSLRAAHDTLARPQVKAVKQSGVMPVLQRPPAAPASPASPTASRTGAIPVSRPPTGTGSTQRLGTVPATGSQAIRTPSAPSTQPLRPMSAQASQPIRPIRDEPSRPARMPAASPPPAVGARRATPSAGVRSVTPRPAAPPPASPAAGGAGDGAPELAPILALLEQNQFAVARAALEVLAAQAPGVVRYRALIAYSKGREAQLAGDTGGARVELMEALQLDPDLQLARIAQAELFSRRK